MLNVVKRDDSSSNSTCQYPLLQSTLVKTFALDSSGSTSSIVGIGWWHRFSALLSGLGSRHNLILPLGFGATTIALRVC